MQETDQKDVLKGEVAYERKYNDNSASRGLRFQFDAVINHFSFAVLRLYTLLIVRKDYDNRKSHQSHHQLNQADNEI